MCVDEEIELRELLSGQDRLGLWGRASHEKLSDTEVLLPGTYCTEWLLPGSISCSGMNYKKWRTDSRFFLSQKL